MFGKYNCLNPDFGDFFDGDLLDKRDWMIGLDFMGLMELGFYGIKGKQPFLFNL